MVWIDATKPCAEQAKAAADQLKTRDAGNRVLLFNPAISAGAFDLSDPAKFYGQGPFIAADILWYREFFGRLRDSGATVDRLVLDHEGGCSLFHLENKFGLANIPKIVGDLLSNPVVRGRLPQTVLAFGASDFVGAKRVDPYVAFNGWAFDALYCEAFRDAILAPAREAGFAPNISNWQDSFHTPPLNDTGTEWPLQFGGIYRTSSPHLYLQPQRSLNTVDKIEAYRLDWLGKCAAFAKDNAGYEVVPWIAPPSFVGDYGGDPLRGLKMFDAASASGVTEILYWNAPSPQYRPAEVAARDDAMVSGWLEGRRWP